MQPLPFGQEPSFARGPSQCRVSFPVSSALRSLTTLKLSSAKTSKTRIAPAPTSDYTCLTRLLLPQRGRLWFVASRIVVSLNFINREALYPSYDVSCGASANSRTMA